MISRTGSTLAPLAGEVRTRSRRGSPTPSGAYPLRGNEPSARSLSPHLRQAKQPAGAPSRVNLPRTHSVYDRMFALWEKHITGAQKRRPRGMTHVDHDRVKRFCRTRNRANSSYALDGKFRGMPDLTVCDRLDHTVFIWSRANFAWPSSSTGE